MADKPSRGLVICGDGLMRHVDESHNHLHSLASRACCGFLSLPNAPPSEGEDSRITREFAQLLDGPEPYQHRGKDKSSALDLEKKSLPPIIAERFMGIKAAVVTSNPGLRNLGWDLGLTVISFNELIKNNHPLPESLSSSVAIESLKLLGFQYGKVLETSQFDLVFVHLGAGEMVSDYIFTVEHVNALLGEIIGVAPPGSEIGSRLLLSVVMSYGEPLEDDHKLSVQISKDEMTSDLSSLIPCQSYTMRGGNQRENVRHYCPMLVAQLQDAVTRRDAVQAFSFEDFKKRGGNLTIPADRFLHEVAFKLWKAPKYGA